MSKNNTVHSSNARMLTEAGLCIAMAIALSYLKIPLGVAFGGFGGSIDLVMIPLVFFSLKWGAKWGITACLIFGTLKYFLGSGLVISWISIIFDYSVAYAAVGLAGLFADEKQPPSSAKSAVAAFVACFARFVIHYISGATVYAQWMPEEFMNFKMTTPLMYSLLYNGTYMLPNTILCVGLMAILARPLRRLYLSK